MKKTIFLVVLLLINIYIYSVQFESLYADHKSYSTGDIITVLITESSSANASANSETDKSFNHNVGSSAGQGPLDFIPLSSMALSSKNSSSGDAKTSRQGSLKATMTARIMSIDDNGNLFIVGQKSVHINGEEEITTLEGIVRPQDVGSDNTVYSYNIANAKIAYKGKGTLKQASKIGIISKIFNFIF